MTRTAHSRRSGRQQGMTLIELVLAVAILLPTILVVVQNFVRCKDLTKVTTAEALTMQGVRDKITSLQLMSFSDVVSQDNLGFNISGVKGTGKVKVNSDAYVEGLVQVTVNFSRQDRPGADIVASARIYSEGS